MCVAFQGSHEQGMHLGRLLVWGRQRGGVPLNIDRTLFYAIAMLGISKQEPTFHSLG